MMHLEPQQSCADARLCVDTPSWCDGALTITPPTEDDVHDVVAAFLGCLFVAVALLLSDDTVVRCLACRTVGAEVLDRR